MLMTLPASQQRALNAIDELLRRGDPQLARMFGVFTELTRQEGMPAAETLPPSRAWLRRRRGRGRGRRPGAPVAARRAPRWLPPTHLPQPGTQLRRLFILPLLVAATLGLLLLAIVATPPVSPRRCGQVTAFIGPVRPNPAGCAGTGQTQPAPAHRPTG
jgi:hypothetical protein